MVMGRENAKEGYNGERKIIVKLERERDIERECKLLTTKRICFREGRILCSSLNKMCEHLSVGDPPNS